jgi:hypothetical protein
MVFVAFFVLGFPRVISGQDKAETLVPAGTLLHCTLNGPNFSSKTSEVGDPEICNLTGLALFGRSIFPRGAYIGGHLEASKDPGHFFGKGYLRLEFDRIGVEDGVVPVPAKITAVRGFRVSRQGDIIGHGHPVRDAVEWMIPPLWPIKVVRLPARGPRPTLKREEPMSLRLMDDVAIPVPATPPAASRYSSRSSSEQLLGSIHIVPKGPLSSSNATAATKSIGKPPQSPTQGVEAKPTMPASTADVPAPKIIVLRNGTTYRTAKLSVQDDHLNYTWTDGVVGTVSLSDVDWNKTFQQNSQNGSSFALSSDAAN